VTTRLEILNALRGAGVREGDSLVVHSSLRALGPVDGGAEAVIDALLDAAGQTGCVAMPTFNYSRPAVELFDARETPGRTGLLTELFRKRPNGLRSDHPSHSVAAIGRRAAEFLADHPKRGAFGLDSPLDRVAAAGGFVLLIGVSHLSNSTVHVGETHAGVKKFWWGEGDPPRVKVRLADGRVIEHQLDVTASCSRSFNAVDLPLRSRGAIRDFSIGDALCFLMRGRDVIDATASVVRDRPDALFCTKPDCRPCVMARRHLSSPLPSEGRAG